MNYTYQVQVGRRGVITFPKELRDQKNIADGEILNLIELSNDVFVISRRRSQVDEVANRLAQEWQDSGENLESMLNTLREVRAEYDEKKP
ncbi:MAG: AbrB/MazE/SpoVT family DNA-binding domain-containing protein [Anaerolineales bacterium]|nr:AbrB/MazE/SpoVT family DNA-binding domain-containing protein [Chloroflexota bacterium]MBL6983700.1 AbrB/MazE/SpoVT family DNA-binding domain-containing protein [Anaerolineales bacterium]